MQFCGNLRKLTIEDMEEVYFSKSTSGTFCDMLFFYIQALRYCNENEKNEANVSPGKFIFFNVFVEYLKKKIQKILLIFLDCFFFLDNSTKYTNTLENVRKL